MLYIIIAIVVILVLFVISNYNTLVGLRNKVRDQWSQIDVQLKRRTDLIPNILETVKGYAKHETGTFEAVVEARNKLLSSPTKEEEMKANTELDGALGKLFALAESYPELKANESFLDLQSNLKETEDKIAYSRQFYNDSVLRYQNKLEMFPSNIIASIFGFEKENFFEATEEERKNVKVQF